MVRVVKMQFELNKVPDFLSLFEERKEKIRSFPGCSHLELWEENTGSGVFFTYSHWSSEEDLENYRKSDFFKDTWSKTKSLFAAKAEAWSVHQRHILK